jgi:hypothetical protein
MPYPKNVQELLGNAIALGEITGRHTACGALCEEAPARRVPGSDFTWDVLKIDTPLGQIDLWVRSETMQRLQERVPA